MVNSNLFNSMNNQINNAYLLMKLDNMEREAKKL